MKRSPHARRWLSLLLALAMLLPGLGLLGGIEAGASLAKETLANFQVSFVVPETIWLNPAIRDGSDRMSSFRWFSNNNPDGTAIEGAQENQGLFHFSVSGATLDSVTFGMSGATITPAINTFSGAGTHTITGGTLGAAQVNNSGTLIAWTATFYVNGDLLTPYTVQNYSYAYAPSLKAAGAFGKAVEYRQSFPPFSTKYTYYHQAGLTVTGVHSVSGGGYTPNSRLFGDLGNRTYSGGNNTGIQAYYLTAGGAERGLNYDEMDESNLFSSGIATLTVHGGTGTVNVDVSRFRNLNQVPGLWLGWWITDNEVKNDDGQGANLRPNDPRIEMPTGTTVYTSFANMNEGLKWSSGPNLGVVGAGSTSELNVWGITGSGYSNDHYANICASVKVIANKIDRTAIRSAIHAATQYPISMLADNNAVQTALRNACIQLGDPSSAAADNTSAALNSLIATGLSNTVKAPVVYFTAPEVIYLKPGDGATAQWQYFADNAVSPRTAATGMADPSYNHYGTVSLYVPGATQVSIHCVTPNVNVKLGYLNRWDGGYPVGGGYADIPNSAGMANLDGNYGDFGPGDAWVMNGESVYGRLRGTESPSNTGSTPAADICSSPNTPGLITWRATFTVNGIQYEAFTHSYVYKPYQANYGSVLRSKGTGSYLLTTGTGYMGTALWAWGVHSVAGSASASTLVSEPGTGAYDQVDSSRLYGDSKSSGNAKLESMLYAGDYTIGNTSLHNYLQGTDNFNDSKYTMTYGFKNTRSAHHYWELTSHRGSLYIDRSRYGNLKDVPNFNFRCMVLDNSRGGSGDMRFHVNVIRGSNEGYYDRSGDLQSGGAATANDRWYTSTLPSNGSTGNMMPAANYTTMKDIDISPGGTKDTYYQDWQTTTLRFGSDIFWSDSGGLGWSYANSYTQTVDTDLKLVNKGDLRVAYQKAVALNVQKSETDPAKYQAYWDALNGAALALMRPDDPAFDQTVSNAHVAAINSAIAALDPGTLTAKANHKSTTQDCDPVLGGPQAVPDLLNETIPYLYSEKIIAGVENIPGYVFTGWHNHDYIYNADHWNGVTGAPDNRYTAISPITDPIFGLTSPLKWINATTSWLYSWNVEPNWTFYYDPITYKIEYTHTLPNTVTVTNMPNDVASQKYDVCHYIPQEEPNAGADYRFVDWLCLNDSGHYRKTYNPTNKFWKMTPQQGGTVTMVAQWDYLVKFKVPGWDYGAGLPTPGYVSDFYVQGSNVAAGGIPTLPVGCVVAADDWYRDEALTIPYDLTTPITEPITIYGKLANPGTPIVNALAQNRWSRPAVKPGTTSTPATADDEILDPLTVPDSYPWNPNKLPYTVLNRTKAPESVDVPGTANVYTLNGLGTYEGSTQQVWDTTYSDYGSGRFLADYFMYTNDPTPDIVLQIQDIYPNWKKPVVSVESFDGSAATATTARGYDPAMVTGSTRLTPVALTPTAIDKDDMASYVKLNPVFDNGAGLAALNARGWVVYRVTVRNFEDSCPTEDGADFLANGEVHQAGTVSTARPNGDRVCPDPHVEDEDFLSFTVYVSYFQGDIAITPVYTGDAVSLKGATEERNWSQNGLLSRGIGTRTTGELYYKDCYYYQFQPGDTELAFLALTPAERKAQSKLWPEAQWQVGVRSAVGDSLDPDMVDMEKAYVHMRDRFGNGEATLNYNKSRNIDGFVELNNFDALEPRAELTGTNEITVTEYGGSGIAGVQLYQYALHGAPGYMQTKCTPVDYEWEITGDSIDFYGITIDDTWENRLTLVITDRAGNAYSAHLGGFTTGNGVTGGGTAAQITIHFVDPAHTLSASAELESQGFLLKNPLQLLDAGINRYPVDVNGLAEALYAPESGVLAAAEPVREGATLRLKVLTLGAVEALMVKTTATGQAVTYTAKNAVVTAGPGSTKIWVIEGNFTADSVLIAARIDGDWSEMVELVLVPQLPDDPFVPGGGSQGAGDGEPGDPQGEPSNENPGDGEPTGDPAPAPVTPAKKNFFQLLLEWLLSLFAIFR